MMYVCAESGVCWKGMRHLRVSICVIVRTWSKESFNLWKGASSGTVMRSEADIKECAVMGSHVVAIIFYLLYFLFVCC